MLDGVRSADVGCSQRLTGISAAYISSSDSTIVGFGRELSINA
jgi:hypothetical protein